jgi:D-mannonate dehydratase
MRKDVNRFSEENIKLESNVNELTTEVTHLKKFERALEEIATEYNSNTQYLCQLVRENRVTLDEMKQVLRDDIVADLANVVFKGERDENSEFSDKEIQRLLVYMRSLPAVTINEELLKQAIQRDRSIFALLALVRDIGLAGVQAGDSIFMIDGDSTELQARFKEGNVLSRSL